MKITRDNYLDSVADLDAMVSRGDLRTARVVVRKFRSEFPKAIYGCLKQHSPGLCRHVTVSYGGKGFREKLDRFLEGDK